MGLLFKEKFMGTKLQKNPAKQMTGFFCYPPSPWGDEMG
jgi:hypothetical protein